MANEYLQEPLDPHKLCAAKREISFELPLESMQRAQELLLSTAGSFRVKLQFSYGSQRLPQVEGELIGDVVLECQRCLEPSQQHLHSEFLWGLVGSDEAAANLPRTHEPVFTEKDRLLLSSAIEDEFLLALPLVAYHPAEDCQLQPLEQDPPVVEPAEKENNPFSALADLKKSLQKKH